MRMMGRSSSRLKQKTKYCTKKGVRTRDCMQLWQARYRHQATSVSPDAHLFGQPKASRPHTPAQGNARVSACTYSPTPCIHLVSGGVVGAGGPRRN